MNPLKKDPVGPARDANRVLGDGSAIFKVRHGQVPLKWKRNWRGPAVRLWLLSLVL